MCEINFLTLIFHVIFNSWNLATRNLAVNYALKRRAILPAVYNVKRLKEYLTDVKYEEEVTEITNADQSVARISELAEIIKQLNDELGLEDLTIDSDDDDDDLKEFHDDAEDNEMDDDDSESNAELVDNGIESNYHDEYNEMDVDDCEPNAELVQNDPLSGNLIFKSNVKWEKMFPQNIFFTFFIFISLLGNWWPWLCFRRHYSPIDFDTAAKLEPELSLFIINIRLPIHSIFVGWRVRHTSIG